MDAATEAAIQRGIKEGMKQAMEEMKKGKKGGRGGDKPRNYMPEGLVAQFLSANGVRRECCVPQCVGQIISQFFLTNLFLQWFPGEAGLTQIPAPFF